MLKQLILWNYVLFTMLNMTSSNTLAQSIQLGAYVYTESGVSDTLQLLTHHRFKQHTFFEGAFFGEGTYSIFQDTLILFFEDIKLDTIPKSLVIIDTLDILSKSLSVNLTVMDKADSSFLPAATFKYNKIERNTNWEGKIVITDKPLYSPASIKLSYLGFEDIEICIPSQGSYNIKVYLYYIGTRTYAKKGRIDKYYIQRISSDYIILKSCINGREIKFLHIK